MSSHSVHFDKAATLKLPCSTLPLMQKFLASDELCVDLGICPSSLAETLIGQVSRFRAAVKVRSTSMLHNIQQGLGGKW